MWQFRLTDEVISPTDLSRQLINQTAGALVTFEGWVRNNNDGHQVTGLEYHIYHSLALKEGQRILTEASQRFELCGAVACHRWGYLQLGEVAVWVGTIAGHRGAAFAGTRFIINQIKNRLPIWKKEFYVDRPPQWVLCCSSGSVEQLLGAVPSSQQPYLRIEDDVGGNVLQELA